MVVAHGSGATAAAAIEFRGGGVLCAAGGRGWWSYGGRRDAGGGAYAAGWAQSDGPGGARGTAPGGVGTGCTVCTWWGQGKRRT